MKITLDLFGFTKAIDVDRELYNRGEIAIPLSGSCKNFEVLPRGADIKVIDIEHSVIMFYKHSDDRWRPKRET